MSEKKYKYYRCMCGGHGKRPCGLYYREDEDGNVCVKDLVDGSSGSNWRVDEAEASQWLNNEFIEEISEIELFTEWL